jgi:hypothetical protein
MMIGLYLLLNLAVLWFAARASSRSGWRLILMLFVAAWVVGSGNSLIEALFFHVVTLREALAAGAVAAVVFVVLIPVAVLTAGRWRPSDKSGIEDGGFTPLTLLGVIVAYELLYWGAGTLVYPYIAHFYASRSLPPAVAIAGLQIVRSLIFVAAVYPLLRSGLRSAPLVLALIYGIVGGLAPLLPDNPYMPPDIRFYHAIETTSSNFIFGLVIGFLFAWPGRPRFKRRAGGRGPRDFS